MGVALGSCTVLGEVLVFLVSNIASVNCCVTLWCGMSQWLCIPSWECRTACVLEGGAGRGAGPAPLLLPAPVNPSITR